MPTPADHKGAHDQRGDETIDPRSEIAEVDGKIDDTTEIDPATQDKEKGFPKGTDDEPMDRYGDTL